MNRDIVLNILNEGLGLKAKSLVTLEEIKSIENVLNEQTFLPWIYYVYKFPEYKKYYLSSYILHQKFDDIRSEITNIFNENYIKHIYLKGSILKDLYPDPNLRMFGDIDVLINDADLKKSKTLLLENNFEYKHVAEHHLEFVKDGVTVELHIKLLPHHEDKYNFFRNPFENAYQYDNNLYRLNESYHFIFVLVHYLKHLKSGAGLREIIDIYLMMEKYKLDYDYIISSVNKLKITDYFNSILTEVEYIFNFKSIEFKRKENIEKLIDYSLSSGIHGFGEANNYDKNAFINSKKSKFKYLLSKLFIPVKTLFIMYPFTKTIILIPLGYIIRFFSLIIKKRNKLNKVLKMDDCNNDFFDQFGI